MLFLNIIFMVTCYPILFIMYFLLRNANDRNGWCFGVTLNREMKKDPEIEVITEEYHRGLKQSTIIFAIIPLFAFFIPYESIGFSLWMCWILAVCFMPMIWYASANKKVLEVKRERGWDEECMVSYTDLKLATVPRKVSFFTFLPALVMNIIPVMLSFVLFSDGFEVFRVWVMFGGDFGKMIYSI